MQRFKLPTTGFTLIELSIVLVIIGLIVGGVMVGQDLVKASEIRAQISQIGKYNIAANTFRGKYGYLPGDIPEPDASRFGFFLAASMQEKATGMAYWKAFGRMPPVAISGACKMPVKPPCFG